jgi:hypothetical protein
LLGNDQNEFLTDIQKKKDAIEKFARHEDKIGFDKDDVTGLTIEDKLMMQLEHKKLYEDWEILKVIENLPQVQTERIFKLIFEHETVKHIKYFEDKRPRFIQGMLSIMQPCIFFEDE